GDRLGCLPGGQGGGCRWGHDDINLERNQFGRKSWEPLELPLGISVFDHDVAALDVTEVTQSLTEGLVHVGVAAAGLSARKPIRAILAACCPSATSGAARMPTARATSTVRLRFMLPPTYAWLAPR